MVRFIRTLADWKKGPVLGDLDVEHVIVVATHGEGDVLNELVATGGTVRLDMNKKARTGPDPAPPWQDLIMSAQPHETKSGSARNLARQLSRRSGARLVRRLLPSVPVTLPCVLLGCFQGIVAPKGPNPSFLQV